MSNDPVSRTMTRRTHLSRLVTVPIATICVFAGSNLFCSTEHVKAAELYHPLQVTAVAVRDNRPIKSVSPSSRVIGPWSFALFPEGNGILRVSIRYLGLSTVQQCTFRSTDPMFTQILKHFDGTATRGYIATVFAQYTGTNGKLAFNVNWREKGKKQHVQFSCTVKR